MILIFHYLFHWGFDTKSNFSAGVFPLSVAVGDFDGDGHQDLAVASEGNSNTSNSDRVNVLLGNGSGSFGSPTHYTVGPSEGSNDPWSVSVGDVDGDGVQDLIVASHNYTENVSVLLGTGSGTFSEATNYWAGYIPTSVTVGDFNLDGAIDMAVTKDRQGWYEGSQNDVSILFNTGNGEFAGPINYGVGFDSPSSIAIGDFDSNGVPDLAVTNEGSDYVSILLGEAFTPHTITTTANGPNDLFAADVDGD